MATSTDDKMLLQSFPAALRYPIIGSVPILALAILGALGYGFFVLLPVWAILTVIGAIVGYGFLYWIGYQLEHG